VPRRLVNALGIRDLARARHIVDLGLQGRSDHDVLRWCIETSHCLLTFDNDFLQRGFDWWRSPGIFLCRIPRQASFMDASLQSCHSCEPRAKRI
jgi:hypothetical protein